LPENLTKQSDREVLALRLDPAFGLKTVAVAR
jgi:hypothetical protein